MKLVVKKGNALMVLLSAAMLGCQDPDPAFLEKAEIPTDSADARAKASPPQLPGAGHSFTKVCCKWTKGRQG